MLKRFTLMVMVASLGLAVANASPKDGKLVIDVNRTNPTDGKTMYQSYCAPCHGADGRGSGPAASAMKTQPADLTQLARLNRGKYPESHIASVLEFGTSVPAHGSAAMPIWGQLFDRIEPAQSQETALRVTNLTRYLETMQVK